MHAGNEGPLASRNKHHLNATAAARGGALISGHPDPPASFYKADRPAAVARTSPARRPPPLPPLRAIALGLRT